MWNIVRIEQLPVYVYAGYPQLSQFGEFSLPDDEAEEGFSFFTFYEEVFLGFGMPYLSSLEIGNAFLPMQILL